MQTKGSPAFKALDTAPAKGAETSVVALVNDLIADAHQAHASDIHIDPREGEVKVRMRIDGVLCDSYLIDKKIHAEIISRIKVLSGMRTDEHQATQDGRFRHTLEGGGLLDMRVSIAPTYHGENVVLRLLAGKGAD